MNMKFLPVVLLSLGITGFASAQTKEKSSKEKDESITIRKKSDSNEKLTIVVDGDNITVNGKPLEELKNADIEVLRNRGLSALRPRMRMGGSMGGMKMFDGEEESNRAFLGVTSEKVDNGVKVLSVEEKSAAEKAGLKKDDIITKVGDQKIEGSTELYDAIGKYKPEDNVTITYLRDGKPGTANATLGKTEGMKVRNFNINGNALKDFNFKMPDMDGMDFRNMPRINGMVMNRKPKIGLEIQDLENSKGVKVLDVDGGSPAAKAGLQKDDIIMDAEGKSITSVDGLKTRLGELKEGDSVTIHFQRNGKSMSADIKIPKKLKTADL